MLSKITAILMLAAASVDSSYGLQFNEASDGLITLAESDSSKKSKNAANRSLQDILGIESTVL